MWLHSCSFVECYFLDFFQIVHSILRHSHVAFSQNISLKSTWYNQTVVLIWLQLGRIYFIRGSDLHMVFKLLIRYADAYVFSRCNIATGVCEMIYLFQIIIWKWYLVENILSEFTSRPIPLATCFRPCSRNSA